VAPHRDPDLLEQGSKFVGRDHLGQVVFSTGVVQDLDVLRQVGTSARQRQRHQPDTRPDGTQQHLHRRWVIGHQHADGGLLGALREVAATAVGQGGGRSALAIGTEDERHAAQPVVDLRRQRSPHPHVPHQPARCPRAVAVG
jgi:hypothetical protein